MVVSVVGYINAKAKFDAESKMFRQDVSTYQTRPPGRPQRQQIILFQIFGAIRLSEVSEEP